MLGLAAAVVVTSTTGMGFAAAEPAVPDPTNAHLWRPVNRCSFRSMG
jgi:hypothetical protein